MGDGPAAAGPGNSIGVGHRHGGETWANATAGTCRGEWQDGWGVIRPFDILRESITGAG